MKERIVWVQIDSMTQKPVRIFKNSKAAFASEGLITSMRYSAAVESIRHDLFIRSGGWCELCGDRVSECSGHMHEQKFRGKGGEISLENSVFICAKTHKDAHKDRNPQFTRRTR
jgi:5-methylcytosine-specific restriction endonuclease McrA